MYDVGLSAYSLFDRSIIIESVHQYHYYHASSEYIPVTLQDINIVKLQPLQGSLDRIKDVLYISSNADLLKGADLSAKTVLIDFCFADGHEALSENDVALPRRLDISI